MSPGQAEARAVTDTSAMDFRLSDFLSAADSDDDAIARMLAAGKPHPSRTYHFDIPVTIRRVIPLPSETTVLVEADIRQQPENYLWTHQRFARM